MSAVSNIDKMYFVSQRDYEQTESDSSDDTIVFLQGAEGAGT